MTSTCSRHAVGVTAVIPTFNRAELLRDAIASVIGQDFEPLEVIVVDDGSTDDTGRIVEAAQRRSRYPIKAIHQANAGPAAARNTGILEARHELVAFLDSDNGWRPSKLRHQVDFLVTGDYEFTFTAYAEVGTHRNRNAVRVTGWDDDPVVAMKRLLIGCVVNTSTVIAKRDLLLDVGLFDPSLPPCEDHDLWLKVAAHGSRFGYLDQVLTDYRVHAGSISQDAASVARTSERLISRFFREHDLPAEIKQEEAVHLSRWYVNSACRYLEAGSSKEARRALWRAFSTYPRGVRPGWFRLLIDSATHPRRRMVWRPWSREG